MKIEFDNESIRLINLLENILNVNVKDCVIDKENDIVYFIVESERKIDGQMVNILRKVTNKNIFIIKFSNDINTFLKNLIPSMQFFILQEINGKKILKIKVNKYEKGKIIGKNKRNLMIYKRILERNFGINELQII